MEKTHLLCYVRRDHLTSWKLDSVKRGAEGQPVLAYGSKALIFSNYAKPGNVIWVIGAHTGLQPTLEAKIEIADQLHKYKEYDFEAKSTPSGGSFFGLNDASSAIMQLVFESQRSVWSLRDKYSSTRWEDTFGMKLQAPRRLATEGVRVGRHLSTGAAPLEHLEDAIRMRSIFISWKHCDESHEGFLRALCMELIKRQFSVWWDQTALTNVEEVNKYKGKKKLMGGLLRQGLSQSTAILALWTKSYGTASRASRSNWTQDEWHASGSQFRFALSPDEFQRKDGMAEPYQVLRIPPHPTPEDAIGVARRFRKLYDSVNRTPPSR